MEPFIGLIQIFGFNFAPRGWALCDGQLLSIAQNSALFSLLGTTFGGDGRTTFGLPDLRGRNAIHVGNGPGLSPASWGQRGGAEQHTLSVANLPPHTHGFNIGCNNTDGETDNPDGAFPGPSNEDVYAESANGTMADMVTSQTGNSTSINHRDPYLAVFHCIALTGVFPSRN